MASTHMGMNRTGIDMSPVHSREMARSAPGTGEADGKTGMTSVMHEYVHESDGVGSVPVPGTFKGGLIALKDKLTGKNAEVLINKLGERIAYERTGVRMYEAFIAKCEAHATDQVGAVFTMEELRRFRNEEAAHFTMLSEVMRSIGADPTALTPDADVAAVNSIGVLKVITDPRTSVPQSLQALLTAELVDGCGWELLITLCDDFGMSSEADRFRQALQDENNHLAKVKQWHEALVTFESGAMPSQRQ